MFYKERCFLLNILVYDGPDPVYDDLYGRKFVFDCLYKTHTQKRIYTGEYPMACASKVNIKRHIKECDVSAISCSHRLLQI